ncbi:unnamed protein product, partial [Chrysoparadoxa australica]
IVKVTTELTNLKKSKDKSEKDLKGVPKKELKDINVGDFVFVAPFGKDGKVLKINKDKAYVEAGGLKSWIKKSDLFQAGSRPQRPKNQQVMITVQKNQEGRGLQLDARGMRREKFLNAAEKHLMDVLNGDLPFVDIIHGHGDGILKKSLYELLSSYDGELRYGYVEGNMGTTRVELFD